ncbi:uncharacterized protein CPUR_05630 [Claviceps purpurea 20.1]|uniref:F-box domain-containing protein n=1 Tax=Claviceps purpurea (strain 20.1) TaxID=1111077 RepID=M1W8C0_CLAP2|nr:uncharacterized protein CPUR_05630 [Claviceps purpurea 20.1]
MGSSPMILLPPEMKDIIISHLELPEILHLGQTCRDWNSSALKGMYRRDAVEHKSRAVKYMAYRAIDEETTDLAIQTLERSKEFGKTEFELNSNRCSSIKDKVRKNWTIYQVSTALHWAIWRSNVRLAQALLEKGANPKRPSEGRVVTALTDEEITQKLEHYRQNMTDLKFTLIAPIFVAFIKEDRDMLELLLEAEAGPKAVFDQQSGEVEEIEEEVEEIAEEVEEIEEEVEEIEEEVEEIEEEGEEREEEKEIDEMEEISILHFAAADGDADFGLLELLFDKFSEYINEKCTIDDATPLHVALKSGSTRGMQLAVNTGAEREARNFYDETPLVVGVRELSRLAEDAETFEEHITCLRSFVNLGGDLNPPDGDTLLPEHGDLQGEGNVIPGVPHRQADLEGGTRWSNSNVANELVLAMLPMEENHPGLMMVRQLLLDFADQGLIFAQPAFWLPSPLYLVMCRRTDPQAQWLFAFLTKMKATIHAEEARFFFLGWCESRLWQTTAAAWRPHIESIPQDAVLMAYAIAFSQDTSELYDLIMDIPLAAPHSAILLTAIASKKAWSWRVTLARVEDNFLTSFSFHGDGILHITVRFYLMSPGYSAAEAIQDISMLVAAGANIAMQNRDRQNPLQLLLHLLGPNRKEDLPELVAYLETLL